MIKPCVSNELYTKTWMYPGLNPLKQTKKESGLKANPTGSEPAIFFLFKYQRDFTNFVVIVQPVYSALSPIAGIPYPKIPPSRRGYPRLCAWFLLPGVRRRGVTRMSMFSFTPFRSDEPQSMMKENTVWRFLFCQCGGHKPRNRC
jgi:hypothetical protein